MVVDEEDDEGASFGRVVVWEKRRKSRGRWAGGRLEVREEGEMHGETASDVDGVGREANECTDLKARGATRLDAIIVATRSTGVVN